MVTYTQTTTQAKEALRADLPPWLEAILNPDSVSYERLPMLEVIFERVTRTLSTNLRNVTSDNVEVSLSEITSMRFGEHLDQVADQSLIGIFSAETWEGAALIIADSPLIYSIVNVFLGGRRIQENGKSEQKTYTTIERNLVKRLFAMLLTDLEIALEPLSPTKFSIDRLETSPKFAAIVKPSNAAILVRIQVQMEGKGGAMELLLPYVSLEALRPRLLEIFLGEKIGHDSLWAQHISEEIRETNVTLDAILDEVPTTLGTVLEWTEGSSFALNATPESPVLLRCGKHPLFSGKMGQKNNHIAVFVDTDHMNYHEETTDHA